MARRFFDPERGLWKLLGYLGDFVMLSLLWAVCCIPVVTVGTATAALYDTVVHALRRKDDALLVRFFATLRRELINGVLSTLLWAALLLAGYFLFSRLAAAFPEGGLPTGLMIAFMLLCFFALCILAWVFPLLSRFTIRPLPLNAAALRLAFGHILRSAGLALLIAGTGVLCFLFAFPLMVLPGAAALAASYLIEPVFHAYEQPDTDSTPDD